MRFTIRELMLLTVMVGIGIAWYSDRSRLHAAQEALTAARLDEAQAGERSQRLREEIHNTGEQLPQFHLRLFCRMCSESYFVARSQNDSTQANDSD